MPLSFFKAFATVKTAPTALNSFVINLNLSLKLLPVPAQIIAPTCLTVGVSLLTLTKISAFIPRIPRGTERFDNLYRYRTLIERTIYLLKYPLGVASRKSFSLRTADDLYIAGIAHLIGVICALATNKLNL